MSEVPIVITSSPSMDSESDLIALPTYSDSSKISNENDEFDTSFINNNTPSVRRVSFLRSPTSGNLNASTASRGNVRRWSQSLTNAAKSRQQKTIHFMPSRLKKHGQLLRTVPDATNIEPFVHEIEKHDYLMEDSAAGEQLRNDTLRALPQLLSAKLRIKSRIGDIVKEKSIQTGSNRWKRACYFVGFCTIKTKYYIRNTMRNAALWKKSMKEIEGYFGAGVETYFRFFRFLFVINICLMIISLIFIVFPQLLYEYYFKESSSIVSTVYSSELQNESVENSKFMDLITAQGSLRKSSLFYGGYTNNEIQFFESFPYSLPYAYLMTMMCLYAISFIIISITTAESYRKSFIATSGGEALRAHKLFCAWDFGISNQRAANMKKDCIYFELKSILDEIYDKCYNNSFWQRISTHFISIAVWMIVIGILIGISYAIGYLKIFDKYDESELSIFLHSSPLYIPTAIIIAMILFQMLFEWLGTLENYKSPRSQLHISLIRNYLLEIVIVSSLLMFWLSRSEDEECWETTIGQEVFRLIVIEFIFVGCIGTVIRSIRFLLYKFLWPDIGLCEFNISRGCLGLILNQTLLWIGLFFSPAIAAVVVFKMIAIFYVKKIVLIHFSKPPSKLWRSSQTFTLFLAMIFVSLTIVIVFLLYILTQINVSKECGPFSKHQLMFHVIRGDILKLQEKHILWQLIILSVRPAAIGGILLTLCVLVYYIRTKSKARTAMVKLLKEMLYIEAKDKEFLLANITRVTQENEWLLEDLIRQRKSRFNLTMDSVSETNSFWQNCRDATCFSGESNADDSRNHSSIRNFNLSRASDYGLKQEIENLRKRRTLSTN